MEQFIVIKFWKILYQIPSHNKIEKYFFQFKESCQNLKKKLKNIFLYKNN